MTVFEAVKQSVSARQAAEHYGIRVGRSGMACCPFHEDRHPSMKLDQRFHCFGCGADGDVIDFAARFFDLDARKAAQKLCNDFLGGGGDWQQKPVPRTKSKEQMLREQRDQDYKTLILYYRKLRQWEGTYAPKEEVTAWHPLFAEAMQKKARVEFLLDELLHGDWAQDEFREEVKAIELRLSECEYHDGGKRVQRPRGGEGTSSVA